MACNRWQKMNGLIFISYRRDDSAGYAHALYGKLREEFASHEIFMDVDMIEPGEDFINRIEIAVNKCEVLVALIGKRWLFAEDETGRRLDNPNDFVRLEIQAALERKIRLIPVLVDGASPLRIYDLPSTLIPLARLQVLEIIATRFDADLRRLIELIQNVLDKNVANTNNQRAKKYLNVFDRVKATRRIFLGFSTLTLVGAIISGLSYLILGHSIPSTPSKTYRVQPIVKKNNPRFVTRRRQRDVITSLQTDFYRNSKSNIIHFVLPSKVIRFVSSINEIRLKKSPVAQTKELILEKTGSRLHLMSASFSFENTTMKLIRAKLYDDALIMLKNSLMHDIELQRRSGKRPNYRLYDLFTGLSIRYARTENIEYTIDVIKRSNQIQDFSDRIEKWTNKNSRWYRGWSNKRNTKQWAGLPM